MSTVFSPLTHSTCSRLDQLGRNRRERCTRCDTDYIRNRNKSFMTEDFYDCLHKIAHINKHIFRTSTHEHTFNSPGCSTRRSRFLLQLLCMFRKPVRMRKVIRLYGLDKSYIMPTV